MTLKDPARKGWSVALPALSLAASQACAGEVGPPRLAEALRTQPDSTYTFVVTMANGREVDASLADRQDLVPLPLLNGYAAPMSVADAFGLATRDDVRWVWYLHPDEATGTVPAIRGLDYAVRTMPLPNLANLSLGPPPSFYVTTPDEDAPMPRALREAAGEGLIAVVAIGNVGDTAPGYVNPWSTPDEVIAVGAWDHRTGAVWSASSTALPEEPASWPDVVAPGVDVIGPWPTNLTKSASRRARDEANERFVSSVAPEDRDRYTLNSGTSQAAAVVSGSAAQILRFLNGAIRERGTGSGGPLFSLTAGPDRITEYDRSARRITGTATPTADGGMTYTYALDLPWKMVKQLLIDTAIPVEGARPWEAGAGLVDPDYIRAQFGAYGSEPPQVLPVKVQ